MGAAQPAARSGSLERPMPSPSLLGVLYAADAYANAHRKMGRQQAGAGLLGP